MTSLFLLLSVLVFAKPTLSLPRAKSAIEGLDESEKEARRIWREVNDHNFTKIAGGIYDAWQKADPENVKNDRFNMEASGDRVWLVANRMYRPDFDSPWDSPARGGIVSVLDLQSLNWTHTPYDRLDNDTRGAKVFSVNDHLYLMTYSTNTGRALFHKLFFWQNDLLKWKEIPFVYSLSVTTATTNRFVDVVVSVSYAEVSDEAFVATSVHGLGSGNAEFSLSKLSLTYQNGIPSTGALFGIARVQQPRPVAVSFIGRLIGGNMVFLKEFTADGYYPSDLVYTFYDAAQTNQTDSNFTLKGHRLPYDLDRDRTWQLGDEIFAFGGNKAYGLGRVKFVGDVYTFDTQTLEWHSANITVPSQAVSVTYYTGFLYAGGLKDGISLIYFPSEK